MQTCNSCIGFYPSTDTTQSTQEQTQPMQGQTQATQPTEVATDEYPEGNANIDIEFEMLAANFTATFKATQTQPNLVASSQSITFESNQSVPAASNQSAHAASSQSAHAGIILSASDYILLAPVPTADEVLAAPSTPTCLKPVEYQTCFSDIILLIYVL